MWINNIGKYIPDKKCCLKPIKYASSSVRDASNIWKWKKVTLPIWKKSSTFAWLNMVLWRGYSPGTDVCWFYQFLCYLPAIRETSRIFSDCYPLQHCLTLKAADWSRFRAMIPPVAITTVSPLQPGRKRRFLRLTDREWYPGCGLPSIRGIPIFCAGLSWGYIGTMKRNHR